MFLITNNTVSDGRLCATLRSIGQSQHAKGRPMSASHAKHVLQLYHSTTIRNVQTAVPAINIFRHYFRLLCGFESNSPYITGLCNCVGQLPSRLPSDGCCSQMLIPNKGLLFDRVSHFNFIILSLFGSTSRKTRTTKRRFNTYTQWCDSVWILILFQSDSDGRSIDYIELNLALLFITSKVVYVRRYVSTVSKFFLALASPWNAWFKY